MLVNQHQLVVQCRAFLPRGHHCNDYEYKHGGLPPSSTLYLSGETISVLLSSVRNASYLLSTPFDRAPKKTEVLQYLWYLTSNAFHILLAGMFTPLHSLTGLLCQVPGKKPTSFVSGSPGDYEKSAIRCDPMLRPRTPTEL